MKEAMLYQKLDGGAVRCALCAHRCRIAAGQRGICAVRENRDGVLYSLVYGRSISAAVDPIEKKPLYHFLPSPPRAAISPAPFARTPTFRRRLARGAAGRPGRAIYHPSG
jgi:pyruvate formate lyase activating enzyme